MALVGYDPVAYFTEAEAKKGDAQFQIKHEGVSWYFSSEKNQSLFLNNPEKYMPEYGGFCALGSAHFGAVPTDPTVFTIHKGKLYFNMTPPVKVTWQLNADFHIERANKAWSEEKITFY